MSIPMKEQLNLDGKKKDKIVQRLHAKVRDQLERKNETYAQKHNKGRKEVILEPGDWV